MTVSARFQLLTCLMLYASCAHAIKVKFGTNEGPIMPPTPEPSLPPPQPSRVPAPVWEERSNDTPDPNAQWRPQLFIPQPRYTQVVYNAPGVLSQPPLTNAQRFVNSYIPRNAQQIPYHHRPIKAQPITNYFTPAQIVSQLSSQSLPGFGIRYFVPDYVNRLQERKEDKLRHEDAKNNHLETNDVNSFDDSGSDRLWKLEKDAAKRVVRTSQEGVVNYVYQWPQRHQ